MSSIQWAAPIAVSQGQAARANSDGVLKVALVGCGKIADAHVEEVLKQKGARLVGVCDSERLMAEQLAVRYSVPKHYDDFEEMLCREEPDVVHVTTPPQSHLALATQALRSGCHVFVEKPLTLDHSSAKALIECANGVAKKITVGYIYQFDPPAQAMRRLVRAGELGKPVHVESFYGYNVQGPYGSAFARNPTHWVNALPGKLFQNVIDHCVNKVSEFIVDENPVIKILAYSRDGTSGGLAQELRIMIRGQDVSAFCTLSTGARPTAHFLRVYGTKRTLHADYVTRTVTFDATPTLPSTIGRLLPPFFQASHYWCEGWRNVMRFARSDYHFFAGLNALIGSFYDAIRTDGPLPIPYRDILWVSKVTEQIFDQLNEHAIS